MIAAIVLAAGQSSRMGKPKMGLAWGDTTVLGQVLRIVQGAGMPDILVITGAALDEIQAICRPAGVRTVPNPDYAAGEMLSSLQVGFQACPATTEAALIVLGDQPQIEDAVVKAVVQAHLKTGHSLVVPSFQRRRGHPWLVGRDWWPELLNMRSPQTPRDFLNGHAPAIQYVEVETPSILQDIDTPEEYLRSKP